jgi:hypothetical protein
MLPPSLEDEGEWHSWRWPVVENAQQVVAVRKNHHEDLRVVAANLHTITWDVGHDHNPMPDLFDGDSQSGTTDHRDRSDGRAQIGGGSLSPTHQPPWSRLRQRRQGSVTSWIRFHSCADEMGAGVYWRVSILSIPGMHKSKTQPLRYPFSAHRLSRSTGLLPGVVG